MLSDLAALTIEEAARLLRAGQLSSVELLRAAESAADDADDRLGIYARRFSQNALDAAAMADRELAAGHDRGPLHGIPIGIKDVIAAAEGPTTANSAAVDPMWGIGRDAAVVARLREGGAVITGKTTTMELAVGFADPERPGPMPRNPWRTTCWPGGSSSGSAVGVAVGAFLGSLGTDSGGSIRTPAAFCGVTGLLPTFGTVPTTGTVPLAFSLDHVGPMARGAWDCGAIEAVIAGGRPPPASHDVASTGMRGMRVGVVDGPSGAAVPASATAEALDAAVRVLEDLGASVEATTLPHFEAVTAATFLTLAAEGCAAHRQALGRHWSEIGKPTRRGVLAWGTMMSADEYVQAQRVRRIGQLALADRFADLDVVVMPTYTIGAPSLATLDEHGLGALAGASTTTYWNGVGNPVLAVPIGVTDEGLPLSMQIAGRPFADRTVLDVGIAYQAATDWHRRVPRPAEAGDG